MNPSPVCATKPVIATGAKVALAALAGIVGWPALLVAAIAAAGVAIWYFWDDIKAGAAWVWDQISGLFEGGAAKLGEWGGQAAQLFSDAFGAASDFVGDIFSGITELGGQAAQLLGDVWATLGEVFSQVWEVLVGAATDAMNGVIGVFTNMWNNINAQADEAWQFLREGFDGLAGFVTGVFDTVVGSVERAWERIKNLTTSITTRIKSAFSSDDSGGDSVQGLATGGMVRGPGTGTSDSILARLSDGEFVLRAAAVRHYGVELLQALNGLRLPRLPGFANGGLVQRMPRQQLALPAVSLPRLDLSGLVHGLTTGLSMPMPAFADGGMVAQPAGGRPLTLHIDGQEITGLTATEEAAEKLARYAANRRLRSLGHKPSWVG